LPKYSPEFNAQERIWHYTRQEATHNRFFEKPADLCASLFRTFEDVQKHPEEIQGLLTPFF
jgi:transposase